MTFTRGSNTVSLVIFVILAGLLSDQIETKISRWCNRVESSQPDIQTVFYEVQGRTPAELIASKNECRPFLRDGQTDWNIAWRYWYEHTWSGYTVTSLGTDVEIRYTMPKWIDQDQADPAVRQEWLRYIDCLTIHEVLHGHHALDCAQAIENHFSSNTVSAKNPEELSEVVDSLCNRFIEEYAAKDVTYDKETDYGRTQGARYDFSESGH